MTVSESGVQTTDGLGRPLLHVLSSNGAGRRDACHVLPRRVCGLGEYGLGDIAIHTARLIESPSSALFHYHEIIQCLLEAFPLGVHVIGRH